jgi:hypothetical protein
MGSFRSFRAAHSSDTLREGAGPEIVRGDLGHANVVVTQHCQQAKGDTSIFPETPHSSYSQIVALNDNLVHLFLDEVHSHDMAHGLTIRPKRENSR